MRRAKLDTSRGYGEVFGDGENYRYVQDGKKFDGGGFEVLPEPGNVPIGGPRVTDSTPEDIESSDVNEDEIEPEEVEEDLEEENDLDVKEEDVEENPMSPVDIVMSIDPDSYEKREDLLEALDILEVEYNPNMRNKTLIGLLKEEMERRKAE